MWEIFSRFGAKASKSEVLDQTADSDAPSEAGYTRSNDQVVTMQAETSPQPRASFQHAACAAPAKLTVITEFDAALDALVIEAAPEVVDALNEDSITVKRQGADALVCWEGYPVIQVAGGASAVTVEDVRVVAADTVI